MISHMDMQIGRLLDKLEELGVADNTVVFFTSDNGTTMLKDQVDYEFFESVANLRGLKGEVYEGGVRVPMLVRWPGKVKPGTVTDHISAHYDALATIADIVDIDAEQAHDGNQLPAHFARREAAAARLSFLGLRWLRGTGRDAPG